jgi:hypothetical protein
MWAVPDEMSELCLLLSSLSCAIGNFRVSALHELLLITRQAHATDTPKPIRHWRQQQRHVHPADPALGHARAAIDEHAAERLQLTRGGDDFAMQCKAFPPMAITTTMFPAGPTPNMHRPQCMRRSSQS